MKLNLKIKSKNHPKKRRRREIEKITKINSTMSKKYSMATRILLLKQNYNRDKNFHRNQIQQNKGFYRKITYVMAISLESCSYIIFFGLSNFTQFYY